MKVQAVVEYNPGGYLIYAANYPGAYVRGESEAEALAKFPGELRSYLRWSTGALPPYDDPQVEIVQRKPSQLQIKLADSDVLFDAERQPLTPQEFEKLKLLVLRSARDIRRMFNSIPNPDISDRPKRVCFYGAVPRTPREMYEHINQTTAYYVGAFGVALDNVPDLYTNRLQALSALEDLPDPLSATVYTAPDGELWTMRKVLRRFLWHDRIHARAMWRTASALWSSGLENPFFFL